MGEIERNRNYGIVSGVMFIIIALVGLSNFLRWMHFNDLFFCIGSALVGIGILAKDKDKLIVAGFLVTFVVEVIIFFENFYYNNYDIWDYYYTHFNIFCILPNLIKLVAVAGMAVVAIAVFTDKLDKYKAEIMKIWFVPLILRGFAFIVAFVVMLGSNGNWVYSYGWISITNFFLETLAIVSFLLLVLWAESDISKNDFRYEQMNSERQSDYAGNAQNTSEYVPDWIEMGHIDMTKHVLLLIFTLGIWNYIWIYKVTEYLNNVKGTSKRGQVAQLLLCLFVPFYLIYWIYESAKRIDILAKQNGVSSDLTLISTLFAVFLYILAPVFMQDKINDIVRVRRDRRTYSQSVGDENQQNYYSYTETTASNKENTSEGSMNTETAEDIKEYPNYRGYSYTMNNSDDVQESEQSVASAEEDPVIFVHPDVIQSDEKQDIQQKTNEDVQPESAYPTSKSASDIADELKIYKGLLDEGIITQEEFDAKKKSLLGL